MFCSDDSDREVVVEEERRFGKLVIKNSSSSKDFPLFVLMILDQNVLDCLSF